MMYFQCSIQKEKENAREALLKKVANTESLFSTARMHVGSNLYILPTDTTSVHMIKNAKNRCLIFIVIIYVYSHMILFDSIKGTFVTLYTNIVEASLFHFIEGVSSPYQFPPLTLILFLIFPVTVLNVQVFPSLDFIRNI